MGSERKTGRGQGKIHLSKTRPPVTFFFQPGPTFYFLPLPKNAINEAFIQDESFG
jgi:hypothetical protein